MKNTTKTKHYNNRGVGVKASECEMTTNKKNNATSIKNGTKASTAKKVSHTKSCS